MWFAKYNLRSWENTLKMDKKEKIQEKPNLSILALISFIASFTIARTFTTINPDTVLISGNYHIHHFWFGIAMLAIGGWLGISYTSERTDRLAAILFGAGGGLIGDEVGLHIRDFNPNICINDDFSKQIS
jgi:hypothetical protein